MSWACGVDYGDPPEVYFEHRRTRRRGDGLCRLCRCPIRPTQVYLQAAGKWEGDWLSMVAHMRCHDLMSKAADLICGDSGYYWDQTLDDASTELLALNVSEDVGEEDLKAWLEGHEGILEMFGPPREERT